jgi:hypothetical protein
MVMSSIAMQHLTIDGCQNAMWTLMNVIMWQNPWMSQCNIQLWWMSQCDKNLKCRNVISTLMNIVMWQNSWMSQCDITFDECHNMAKHLHVTMRYQL